MKRFLLLTLFFINDEFSYFVIFYIMSLYLYIFYKRTLLHTLYSVNFVHRSLLISSLAAVLVYSE